MNFKPIFLVGAVMAIGVASADNLHFQGTLDNSPLVASVTYTVSGHKHSTGHVAVDILKYKDGSQTINTLCADLSKSVANGNYDTSSIGSGSTALDLAGRIVASNLPAVQASGSKIESAGLQIAVWYALYAGTTSFSLTNTTAHMTIFTDASKNFSLSFSGNTNSDIQAVTDAASYFSNSASGIATYYNGGKCGGQSQIGFVQAAPEPVSLAFIGVGVVGLLAKRRK